MASRAYSRVERERRFLLSGLPRPLTMDAFHCVCTDLYLDGLRLRLRSLVPSDGGLAQYKLGQKHHPEGMASHEREMTTFYLTEDEYTFLANRLGLGAHRLVKRRYPFDWEGHKYSVDVFEEGCAGLVLADLEVADPDVLAAIGVPAFAVREVTADPTYEGGTLARTGHRPPLG